MSFKKWALAPIFLTLLSCQKQVNEPAPRLAVLRCENLSPDPGLDWMGRAISEILSSQLSAPVHATAATTAPGISTEREVAMNAGANRLVACEFDVQAGVLHASAQMEDSLKLRVLERAKAEGPAAGILQVADSLAKQLASQTRPFSTGSQDALRAYAEALDSRDAAAAAEAYSRAVGADPNFGQAYLAWVNTEASRRNRAGLEHVLELAKARGDAIPAFERARLALDAAELRGDNTAKMQALSALAKAGPPDAGVQKGLADAALQGRRYRDAVNAYQRALAIQPDDVAALNGLGYAQAYLGDLNGALDALRKYERLQPNQANPIDSQADVNFYSGHYAEAEKLYLAAHTKDPNFVGGTELLKAAQARLATADIAGADAIFGRYVTQVEARKDPTAGYRKAQWKYLTGHRREAIAMLGPEAAKVPQFQAQIALWELSLGDPNAADRVKKALAATGGQAPGLLALAFFLTQPQAGATEWEARAAKIFPQAALRDQLVGCALLFGRKFADALPYLRKAYDHTNPNNEEGLPVLLAWAMLETGKADGVTSLVGPTPVPQAAGLGPLTSLYFPRLFYLRALNYDRLGKHDQALENYRLFLKLAGNDPELWGEEQRARKALGQ